MTKIDSDVYFMRCLLSLGMCLLISEVRCAVAVILVVEEPGWSFVMLELQMCVVQ